MTIEAEYNQSVPVTIHCGEAAAIDIQKSLEVETDTTWHAVQHRGLDGNAATWAVAATLLVQSLPHTIAAVEKFLPSRRITKIKIGDIEIENPTPEELLTIRGALESRLKGDSEKH
jgi:hypothetical protein